MLKANCREGIVTKPGCWDNAAAVYIQYGLIINDKIEILENEGTDFLQLLFFNATHGWIDYLDKEIGRPVVFDFDLWADSLNFTKSILEGLHKEVIDTLSPLVEACQGVFVAMFRIWYDKITIQDILNFFEDKPCPELPDMSDMRKTFLWAMDNEIPCHDLTSWMSYHEDTMNNESAEDEKTRYMDMARLRDLFDSCDERFVASGIPRDYLDENRLQLREIYYASVAFYEMLPSHTDIEHLVEEEPEKLQRYFEKFIGIHNFPDLDINQLDVLGDSYKYYSIIFVFGLHIGQRMLESDLENGFADSSIFKEAIEHEMNKNKQ